MTDTMTKPGTSVDTWTQLVEHVQSSNGVACVKMHTLREIAGAGRLGSTVRVMMLEKLRSLGLNIIRQELPNTQDATVVLYDTSSRLGSIVKAVQDSERGIDLETNAETLGTLNTSADPGKVRVEIIDAISHLDETVKQAVTELS